MAQATGLLMWGQAGEYNAVDDRMVIGVGLQGVGGLWRPPNLTAGSGLAVTLDAFAAGVPCDDGTFAVAASTSPVTITETAGPSSGSRTDTIWLSADPDNARWGIDIVASSATTGLLGISLGTIVVPAGANLASQFTFTEMITSLGYLRHFYGNGDRRQFLANQGGWGVTGGINLTSISSGGTHLDIANGFTNTWDILYSAAQPGYTLAGVFSTTTGNTGNFILTFPMAFAAPPVCLCMPASFNGYCRIAPSTAPTTTNVNFQALNTSGAPIIQGGIQVHWIAHGRIASDTLT